MIFKYSMLFCGLYAYSLDNILWWIKAFDLEKRNAYLPTRPSRVTSCISLMSKTDLSTHSSSRKIKNMMWKLEKWNALHSCLYGFQCTQISNLTWSCLKCSSFEGLTQFFSLWVMTFLWLKVNQSLVCLFIYLFRNKNTIGPSFHLERKRDYIPQNKIVKLW